MENEIDKPERWEDAAGWERYYASLAATDAPEADGYSPGSIARAPLAGLIHELRSSAWTSIWFPGCGLSPVPKVMAAFGLNVHATDVSKTAVRFQQGDGGQQEVERLKRQVVESGESVAEHPGRFTAVVHDFREPYLVAAFDLVINERAFQGFERPSMDRIAASHYAALRPGRRAIFDTINVQGDQRDEFEEALVGAGFYIPLFEANRRMRRELAATGIPHLFILGRPVIPLTGLYRDEVKRQEDTEVLRRIFDENRSRFENEYAEEQQRVGADAKTATVIYSTG